MEWLLDLWQQAPDSLIPSLAIVAGWLLGSATRGLWRLVRAPRALSPRDQLYQFLMDRLSRPEDWTKGDGGIRHWLVGTDADGMPGVYIRAQTPYAIRVGEECVGDHLGWRQQRKVLKRAKAILAHIEAQTAQERLRSIVVRL